MPNYLPANYYPVNYWPPDYWPEVGSGIPLVIRGPFTGLLITDDGRRGAMVVDDGRRGALVT